jgi:pimeloyl-CoA synthetase
MSEKHESRPVGEVHPCRVCDQWTALRTSTGEVACREHGGKDAAELLAEVTVERDALRDALTIAKTSQDHRLARIRELEGERDALKRRVEELEREVRSLKTYDQFSDL